MRFPAQSPQEVWDQGGRPPQELSGDKYELTYDPSTELVSIRLPGGTVRAIHASRVEWLEVESVPDPVYFFGDPKMDEEAITNLGAQVHAMPEPKREHWKTRQKREREEAAAKEKANAVQE